MWCLLVCEHSKIADYILNYDVTPHLDKLKKRIDWKPLKVISDNEVACLDVCYEIYNSTSAREAAQDPKMLF